MINIKKASSQDQEDVVEEEVNENSEATRLQLRKNSSQNISKSELAKMEKWMNEVVYLSYVALPLAVLGNISFSLTLLAEIREELL